MKKALFVFLTGFLYSTCMWAQTSTIVLYRPEQGNKDKYFIRFWIGVKSLDSIQAGETVLYKTMDEDMVNIRCQIENYAGWPNTRLKLSLIENDTSFIKMELTKDIFGNPKVKLKLVPRNEAEGVLTANVRRVKSDDEDEKAGDDQSIRSGTGFLISSQGLVVTNFHVVDNAKKITVKNIGGNKDSSIVATVVLKDEGNDLAILKMEGNRQFDSIPYMIKNTPTDLGEKIMVFGYPLTNKMGNDVKLTNGIISSVNGYKGDANSYQISAPVQPGNSGGPVFDEKGNLIGVVNAKLFFAENATYAIKSSYLLSTLQGVKEYKNETVTPELWKMSLTEQAKLLQRLVYIIDIK